MRQPRFKSLALLGLYKDGDSRQSRTVDQLLALPIGSVARVALHLIVENKYNARAFYLACEVDEAANSMSENSQLQIARGWVAGGRVHLEDGQKRWRAARAAGLPYLEVKIVTEPAPRDAYLASREANTVRSAQTPLDDAIRWRELIDQKVFADQEDLAQSVKVSVATVSKVLAINLIPPRLTYRMREYPITSSLRVAYEISRIFVPGKDQKIDGDDGAKGAGHVFDDERAEALAEDIIEEVVKNELSADATRTLIKSKLAGPAKRERAEVRDIRCGAHRGAIRLAPEKGSLQLSFTGLTATEVESLAGALEGALRATSAESAT